MLQEEEGAYLTFFYYNLLGSPVLLLLVEEEGAYLTFFYYNFIRG
jgi:hypothetical protein